jgi:hypothetical protein
LNNSRIAVDYEEQNFAQECRKALEKSYDGHVPLPKFLAKKIGPKKAPAFKGEKYV